MESTNNDKTNDDYYNNDGGSGCSNNDNKSDMSTMLRKAVLDGDWHLVESRLETNPEEASVIYLETTCLFEAVEHEDCPINVLEKLISAFPKALTLLPSNESITPLALAIEEAMDIRRIKFLLEHGPEALKIETENSYGIPLHRLWYCCSKEDEREWKQLMKFVLDYYPEAIFQPSTYGDGDFIEWMVETCSDNPTGVQFEVMNMVFDAAYQCLIELSDKSDDEGDSSEPSTRRDYKYLPIHASIELLHNRNYKVMDRFCKSQYTEYGSEAFQDWYREMKECIYTNDEESYWEDYVKPTSAYPNGKIRLKNQFQRHYKTGRFSLVTRMIEEYPDHLFLRDRNGKLPLELVDALLNQESEFGFPHSQAPHTEISNLIQKTMVTMIINDEDGALKEIARDLELEVTADDIHPLLKKVLLAVGMYPFKDTNGEDMDDNGDLPFDDFDRDLTNYLYDYIKNGNDKKCHECGKPNSTLTCSGCRWALYCSKKCQRKHWKGDNANHREVCSDFRDNRKDGSDAAEAFRACCAIGEEEYIFYTKLRWKLFLETSKRSIDSISLQTSVIYLMGEVRHATSISYYNKDKEEIQTLSRFIMKSVDDSSSSAVIANIQRGSGRLSQAAMKKVKDNLVDFIKEAISKGKQILGITFGRGIVNLSNDEEFEKRMTDIQSGI